MSDFIPAFEKMIRREGGYQLTNIKHDRGGQTFSGIARNAWPQWAGWPAIDAGGIPPAELVRDFYRRNFWDVIHGDRILAQEIAESIFDFAVNAGPRTASILAQTVAGVTPDGKVGDKTIAAINDQNTEKFIMAYALAKIARYAAIVRKDRTQAKFLLGWISRALEIA